MYTGGSRSFDEHATCNNQVINFSLNIIDTILYTNLLTKILFRLPELG